jgi:hypothetical protein
MARSEVIGFVRKSKSGNALKINISARAFETAERYTSTSGEEFVSLVANLAMVQAVIDGVKEATTLCQFND